MLESREFSSKELRTVGNYSIGRLIGKGSFGKVYLATHKLTNGSKVYTTSNLSHLSLIQLLRVMRGLESGGELGTSFLVLKEEGMGWIK